MCFVAVGMQVYRTLTARMEAIAGARVEHNKYCLSVHFRCVQEEVRRVTIVQARSRRIDALQFCLLRRSVS
jgi:trehalose 6-phosphate phosphatase